VPVTVTWVAFAADTVRVEVPPAVIDVGFAAIVTVGEGTLLAATLAFEPHPASTSRKEMQAKIATLPQNFPVVGTTDAD
jgi:hypothetical protein